MAALSRIDVVVSKIVALASAATDLQVIDGAIVGEPTMDLLIVGSPTAEGQESYHSSITRQRGSGAVRLTEEFTVSCLISLATGTNDVAGLRSRATAYLGQLDTALRGEARVDGVWDRAALTGEVRWIGVLTEKGAVVEVAFDVEGECLL